MDFTRTQVDAALAALDLDPTDTRSVTIIPAQAVLVESIARADGVPVIEHGQVRYVMETVPIEEDADA